MTDRLPRRSVAANVISAGALAIALAISGSAAAHHSHAHYEEEGVETVVEGTIKSFEWRAPHSWVTLTVMNEQTGEPEDWLLESNSPRGLTRRGWGPDSLEPGDQVAITIRPLRNGSKGGLLRRVDFPDGSYLLDPQIREVDERERSRLQQRGEILPDLDAPLGLGAD